MHRRLAAILAAALALSSAPLPAPAATPAPLAGLRAKIGHIIVIAQENWSFDGLYGHYPGANGDAGALGFAQVDAAGNPLSVLPQPQIRSSPDPRFPANLPVGPFDLAAYVPPDSYGLTGDPNHSFFFQQYEIDGGKMDRYAALPASSQGGLPFGQYDVTNYPEGKIAQQYVLADNFHQSAFGGSYMNNMWSWCACTTVYPDAPKALVEDLDPQGNPPPNELGISEHQITPDGYAVNTIFPANYPQFVHAKPGDPKLLPAQTLPTIGDRLSAAGVSWAWYAGGLDNAVAGHPDATFQPHHQAPLFYANYAPGTPGAKHVRDESQFLADVARNTLPRVSFVKNLGAENEHPGYANLLQGQLYTAYLISQIQMSPVWKDALIVIYYDEAGGHYDHMAPQPVDRWGPSTRVPALIVSPFARHHYVDHTKYEVVSILTTIEQRFGLKPLSARDAAAAPLLGGLDFGQHLPQAYERRELGIEQAPPDGPPPRSRDGRYPVTELDD